MRYTIMKPRTKKEGKIIDRNYPANTPDKYQFCTCFLAITVNYHGFCKEFARCFAEKKFE